MVAARVEDNPRSKRRWMSMMGWVANFVDRWKPTPASPTWKKCGQFSFFSTSFSRSPSLPIVYFASSQCQKGGQSGQRLPVDGKRSVHIRLGYFQRWCKFALRNKKTNYRPALSRSLSLLPPDQSLPTHPPTHRPYCSPSERKKNKFSMRGI